MKASASCSLDRRLAPWTYQCDEQQIDYAVQLEFDSSAGEQPGGNRWDGWRPAEGRWVNVLHVHSIDLATVWIGKCGATLQPSREIPGWEQEICRRLEHVLDQSPAVRASAEAACRRYLGWESFE